ncbi:glycosyltransferase [Flavobacterium sp. LS1R47]|uniref:Glycosyltransferase n=1 Tax=Flavobacterium frigoritolerans TaxID=2987686 RepID=A0A9X2YYW8_9FLAO|nr:glycosyltransferase family 2 protein [Flavobacterium frigoritolerans]MCV9931279.1 glycosyltransferase [Flavobacterium frigoritolerans]
MNNFGPLVSIMIPVYNRENIIGETLDCAINQTYNNIEIIVSDNCSTDKTWSILEEYAKKDDRIKIYKNEINLGPVLNWKNCIDKIQGEYIKILWSDDLMTNDFIQKTLPLFDDDTAFVITGVEYFGDKTMYSEFQDAFPHVLSTKVYLSENILSSNQAEFQLSPGCGIFRRDDLRKNLLIDVPNEFGLDFKKYGAGNDVLMFMLTARDYKFIKIVPELLSKFRFHRESFSVENNLEKYYDLAKYYFVKEFDKRLMAFFILNQFYKRKSSSFHKEFWNTIRKDFSVIDLIKHKSSRVMLKLFSN